MHGYFLREEKGLKEVKNLSSLIPLQKHFYYPHTSMKVEAGDTGFRPSFSLPVRPLQIHVLTVRLLVSLSNGFIH